MLVQKSWGDFAAGSKKIISRNKTLRIIPLQENIFGL